MIFFHRLFSFIIHQLHHYWQDQLGLSSSLLLSCTISIAIVCYLRIITIKKLMNLNCLSCCRRCVAVLMCLLLLKIPGHYQLHQLPTLWFINCPVYKSSRIYWPANNKTLINLDRLACCCHCVLLLLCLPLLIALPDIISFLNLQRFIDSSIAPFVSLLKYIDLLITKKLINLDHLAHYGYCICYSQCFQIFLISLSDLFITIMLMILNRLVAVAVVVCFLL